jgi:hypothetical protein
MKISKTDMVWLAVLEGPVNSAEVSRATGMSHCECSARLCQLFTTGRIERAPYRPANRGSQGGRLLAGWIYYGNEQRPPEHRKLAEITEQRKKAAQAAGAKEALVSDVFNRWIAAC